ncbi:MAG: helix-turn-helix domain-containing protein [Actinomycetota bacterium]|nr:helix-turn-helix domain-containing protein [Actinomycetota bacterium]
MDPYAAVGNGCAVSSSRSPAQVALGRAVRDFRADRGISQEELAHRSHLGRKTIYQLEGGQTNPRYESLLRVAAALGLSLGDLISHADDLAAKASGRCRD